MLILHLHYFAELCYCSMLCNSTDKRIIYRNIGYQSITVSKLLVKDFTERFGAVE
jgi:hypothetical protein